jgi:hypothetical protein
VRCATGVPGRHRRPVPPAHHWSRELQALGHTVLLMPSAYVKPHVKRHKNDVTDAEAICEAVTRPNMRLVATKTEDQQSCLTLHRTSTHEGKADTRHIPSPPLVSVVNPFLATPFRRSKK